MSPRLNLQMQEALSAFSDIEAIAVPVDRAFEIGQRLACSI
jgi:hypothetical protein